MLLGFSGVWTHLYSQVIGWKSRRAWVQDGVVLQVCMRPFFIVWIPVMKNGDLGALRCVKWSLFHMCWMWSKCRGLLWVVLSLGILDLVVMDLYEVLTWVANFLLLDMCCRTTTLKIMHRIVALHDLWALTVLLDIWALTQFYYYFAFEHELTTSMSKSNIRF